MSLPTAKAGERLTFQECERLITQICVAHGNMIPPKLRDGRRARIARGGYYSITLPRWARNEVVILHEIAHSLTAWYGINDKHGPRFMRLFIELLSWGLGLPKSELLKSARAAKIRIAKPNLVPQRVPNARRPSLLLQAADRPNKKA